VPPGDVTVLVVDDDPDLLLLCATHLRLAGYAVMMASGSVEAQATCDIYPTRIDLILVDVLLYPQAVDVDHDRNVTPRVHGDKLIPLLRIKRPLSRILLMSASTPWALGGRGMSGGPASLPLLAKTLHQADPARQGASGAGEPPPDLQTAIETARLIAAVATLLGDASEPP
jgi:CheY-like chemotaxis protein